MKQLKPFRGVAPKDFREKMIAFWMDDEKVSRSEALDAYADDKFDSLCEKVAGNECDFIPDLGYTDKSINGTLCFEKEDNNFCIPVSIITPITESE
jgi:hypothetical protein